MITEYKIAVATSDGINVDRSFGKTEKFLIFEVNGAGGYRAVESRNAAEGEDAVSGRSGEAKTASGCGSGGHGPILQGRHDIRAGLIGDCRAVLCTKAGPQAHKILEHKMISVFDVEMSIEDAFSKIIPYFERVDRHARLR